MRKFDALYLVIDPGGVGEETLTKKAKVLQKSIGVPSQAASQASSVLSCQYLRFSGTLKGLLILSSQSPGPPSLSFIIREVKLKALPVGLLQSL